MLRWKELVCLTDADLALHDIAMVNLACAVGLPDARSLDIDSCCRTIRQWSALTARYTAHQSNQFGKNPMNFENSWAYFKILCMITFLQRHLGVRYNPAKIPVDARLDTADTFVHGIIQGAGGTCASIPVLYVSVGRRLGYPLKLVKAKAVRATHCFARWDEPGQPSFNIEATNQGLSCFPDQEYRTGAYELTPEHELAGQFLQSMTPRAELAAFLMNRAHCWLDFNNYRNAVESFAWACCLAPRNGFYINTLKTTMNRWLRDLQASQPGAFPEIYVGYTKRRFPDLQLELEQDILGLEATENILRDVDLDRRWWAPLRRGVRLEQCPQKAVVDFGADGCHVEFTFASGG